MKKVISMVLTAAMVASLVPATAFAGANVAATAQIVDARNLTKDEAKQHNVIDASEDSFWATDVPELQLEVTKASYVGTNPTAESFEIELTFDNAEVIDYTGDRKVDDTDAASFPADLVQVWKTEAEILEGASGDKVNVDVSYKDVDEDGFTIVLENDGAEMIAEDNVIAIDLESVLTKWSAGTVATVSVESDFGDWDDLVFASVEAAGITATTKKIGYVAEEEWTTLARDLKIKANVGEFQVGQVIELKLSSGFEFTNQTAGSGTNWTEVARPDDNVWEIYVDTNDTDEIVIEADEIEIEAVSAKAGAVCVMTVKAKDSGAADEFAAKTTVEVMEVVDYTVILSVDEDEDVPVIYSGVNVDNHGLTDDSDHLSLEVTVEETFPGAWSMRKGFNFELPEGVYVTNVEMVEAANFYIDGRPAVDNENAWEAAMFNAYQDGDHKGFEFAKRTFDDVNTVLADEEATVTFQLELVADPGFVGDVTLKLTGELVDEQEVVIAHFATPYYVTAEQNDLKIDYRYTEIPTEIVITEAEAGLWEKGEAEFGLYVEKPGYIVFEDDPVFTVEGGLELDDAELSDARDWTGNGGDAFDAIYCIVDGESDEAATITISGMSLFMARDIPAGPYDLKGWTSLAQNYEMEELYAPECSTATYVLVDGTVIEGTTYDEGDFVVVTDADHNSDINVTDCDDTECFVTDVCDYSATVKEAFVNVVTAGREADDASFTTVVKVPVGENVLYAGEVTVELDVPAYINANGYTMLPVRAVATALGINNNNVLWDQATKTVTILYGQRIITMQVGANVVYVNGSAIPATSSVEIVDGRTFLGLRDLATALGVTTIDWDAASKTALLNAEFEA